MKGLAIVSSRENDSVQTAIGKLRTSGMTIERVGEDAYNVISNKTGAVLKRLVPVAELIEYVRCIEYVAERHGRDIAERFSHLAPVHRC